MIYRAYGRVIDSEIDLAADRADGQADLHLRRGDLDSHENGWTNVWQPRERAPWVRVRRSRSDYTIRYEQQVDFQYAPGQRAITMHVHDCAPEPLAHFVLDQVLPLVLSLDAVVLHASAVAIDGAAVAFCGPGGCGKSTLALMLEREGHSIVSDDALLLRSEGGRADAVPSYPGLRFWPEIAAAATRRTSGKGAPRKVRVADTLRFQKRPLPFEHLMVIDSEESEEPCFEPMSPRDTAMAVLENGFRLEQHDPHVLAAELDRALQISVNIRGWRFRYPRVRDAWSEVAAAVVAHVRSFPCLVPRSPSPCCS